MGFEPEYRRELACADDRQALSDEVVAARAADLCQAAEAVADPASSPYYIIGTKVPVPGGAHEDLQELAVTRVEDLARTINSVQSARAGESLGAGARSGRSARSGI